MNFLSVGLIRGIFFLPVSSEERVFKVDSPKGKTLELWDTSTNNSAAVNHRTLFAHE
jgi:hypothetical protein